MIRRRFAGVLFSVFLVFLVVLPCEAAFKVPAYENYVTDTADVLSPEQETVINQVGKELDEKTTAQLAVLTVPTLDETPIEDAALTVARTWGVGSKKTNNGVVILVATEDRKLRMEVGYGLEGIITDGTAGAIQDQYMIPYFKQGDYGSGILAGSLATAAQIAKGYEVTLDTLSGQAYESAPAEEAPVNVPFPVILLILFILWLMMNIMRPRGRGLYGGGFGGFGGGGFGGGGSSFGGFGGGGFGGGGASRDW